MMDEKVTYCPLDQTSPRWTRPPENCYDGARNTQSIFNWCISCIFSCSWYMKYMYFTSILPLIDVFLHIFSSSYLSHPYAPDKVSLGESAVIRRRQRWEEESEEDDYLKWFSCILYFVVFFLYFCIFVFVFMPVGIRRWGEFSCDSWNFLLCICICNLVCACICTCARRTIIKTFHVSVEITLYWVLSSSFHLVHRSWRADGEEC